MKLRRIFRSSISFVSDVVCLFVKGLNKNQTLTYSKTYRASAITYITCTSRTLRVRFSEVAVYCNLVETVEVWRRSPSYRCELSQMIQVYILSEDFIGGKVESEPWVNYRRLEIYSRGKIFERQKKLSQMFILSRVWEEVPSFILAAFLSKSFYSDPTIFNKATQRKISVARRFLHHSSGDLT